VAHEEKINRKALKGPDAFVARGQRLLVWLFEQRVRLLPVLGVALAVVIGLYAFDRFRSGKEREGWEAYYAATKLDEGKRHEAMKSVHARFSETRAGLFAATDVADRELGKAKKAAAQVAPPAVSQQAQEAGAAAAEWYGRALQYKGLLASERQLLFLNRAVALDVAGKLKEALADARAAAGYTGEARALAYLTIGSLEERLGERDKAKATYQKIATDFAGSEIAKLAKTMLRRMDSPLLGEAKR
jgi:hypothetical protein